MDKIGYELYSKLLREELSGKEEVVPELDVRVSAFIPDNYIESNISRMDAYKEIAEINSLEAEKEFRMTMAETYGVIPEEVDNLINIAVVKMLAMKLGVKEINVKKSQTNLIFGDFNAFGQEGLRHAMDEFSQNVSISMVSTPSLEFERTAVDNSSMLAVVRAFLVCAS
jgi:transcription-repair coupling factor (superfamily II helicase)